jgi:hypothetical protein
MFIIDDDLKLTKKINAVIVKLIKTKALIVLFINKEDIIQGF